MGYGNNRNLRGDDDIALTSEQIKEIKKCKENVVYFCKKYVKTANIDHGLVGLNKTALKIVKDFEDNRFLACVNSRQIGMTTALSSYLLHTILFKDKTCAYVSRVKQISDDVAFKFREMYEQIPLWMQKPVTCAIRERFSTKDSTIVFTSISEKLRGYGISCLFIDDAGFIKDQVLTDILINTYPIIMASKNSKVVLTSCGTVKGTKYHDMVKMAENGESNFKCIRYPYTVVKDRTAKFREQMINSIGVESFKREFECEFVGGE